jgi:hypothetical protein
MEIPELTKALYGMTTAEAITAEVCVSCKKHSTWYSPAGKAEYFITGLCEPCFDKITEPEEDTMEITMHKQVGSDVAGVLNNDHAQAAEEFLRQAHFDDKWMVVVADDKTLMLDYDHRPYYSADGDGLLPEQFYVTLGIFDSAVGSNNYFVPTASKGGNTHCVLHMEKPMPIVERIAWQAAFGSDPKREALHLLSVSAGELNPILLFMRKPEGQKLLTGGDQVWIKEHGGTTIPRFKVIKHLYNTAAKPTEPTGKIHP